MPIYTYKCQECDAEWEALVCHKKDEIFASVCSECATGADLIPGKGKRIMSTSSYVMKGYNERNGYSNEKP